MWPRLAKQPRAAECSAPELACSETAMLPSLQARFNIAAGIIRSAMIAADVPPAFARLPRECADDRGGESAMTASFDGQQILPLLARGARQPEIAQPPTKARQRPDDFDRVYNGTRRFRVFNGILVATRRFRSSFQCGPVVDRAFSRRRSTIPIEFQFLASNRPRIFSPRINYSDRVH